jgi:hypothetical protein
MRGQQERSGSLFSCVWIEERLLLEQLHDTLHPPGGGLKGDRF